MANPNPSLANRFKPGNPGGPGRPRGRSVSDRIREVLGREALGADGRPLPGGGTNAERLAQLIVDEALKGDFRFVDLLLNRVEGKAPDRPPADDDDRATLREELEAARAEREREKGGGKRRPAGRDGAGGGGVPGA